MENVKAGSAILNISILGQINQNYIENTCQIRIDF